MIARRDGHEVRVGSRHVTLPIIIESPRDNRPVGLEAKAGPSSKPSLRPDFRPKTGMQLSKANGEMVDRELLSRRLEAAAASGPDVRVHIQADQSVPYGIVAQILSEVKQAKIQKVGLVTQEPEPEKSR